MDKIFLKPKREESLRRFHPWIFSGAVQKMEGSPVDGDVVEVYSADGVFLATGHYQPAGSITVRVLSFTQQPVDSAFWKDKLQKAYILRQNLGLSGNPETTAYRLVHGEGDGFPGLIVDIYGRTAVIQAHTTGMYRQRELFATCLVEIYGNQLTAVYDKSGTTLFVRSETTNGYLYGQKPGDPIFTEHGHRFTADWENGQKTGFFIDQRENRYLVEQYAKDRTVLNMFGYTGAFSVYALSGGAREAHTVDVSQKAIDVANRHVSLNFPDVAGHQGIVSDCFDFLNGMQPIYDLMIVDPPAFAKNQHALKNALQAYRRLNAKALAAIRPAGIYFTFSCSQVVTGEQFRSAIFSAAAMAGRQVRIIHQLTQPADHPINIYHPEGEYLKGLALFVE
ncbi:MAG: class I SAM-dependent rRNA methyltransferase [Bacteroidales bacterium]|jgi:23S rRNA (cytosine1962-C5)-methyltransferase|nr:class I SAM-dependent rRNA methyltransferase [Bacteroidales bacterium]